MTDTEPVQEDFNTDLHDECLQEIADRYQDADLEIVALVAELRHMRALYCDMTVEGWIEDDDPEEWQRWAYHSGKPSWFKLPEWFLQQHEWLRNDWKA